MVVGGMRVRDACRSGTTGPGRIGMDQGRPSSSTSKTSVLPGGTGRPLLAVGQVLRDPQLVLAADRHQLQRLGPARDHRRQAEFGRLVAIVGTVEHGAVQQRATVMHAHVGAGSRLRAGARGQHLVLQARRRGHDARLLAVLGEERLPGGKVAVEFDLAVGGLLRLHLLAEGLHGGRGTGLVELRRAPGEDVVDGALEHGEVDLVVDRLQRLADVQADHVADLVLLGGQGRRRGRAGGQGGSGGGGGEQRGRQGVGAKRHRNPFGSGEGVGKDAAAGAGVRGCRAVRRRTSAWRSGRSWADCRARRRQSPRGSRSGTSRPPASATGPRSSRR